MMGYGQSKADASSEICLQFLEKGSCVQRPCPKIHRLFWWQFLDPTDSSTWISFREENSVEIEKAYCEAKNDEVVLTLSQPSLAVSRGDTAWSNLWNTRWKIAFETMVATPEGSAGSWSRKLTVRRLGTPSAACSPGNIESTTYKWYFRDVLNNWVEFGVPSNYVKGIPMFNTKSDVDSEKIERHYCDPANRQASAQFPSGVKPLPFSTSQHNYNIDFNQMVQINLNPKFNTKRPLRRRPVFSDRRIVSQPVPAPRMSQQSAGNASTSAKPEPTQQPSTKPALVRPATAPASASGSKPAVLHHSSSAAKVLDSASSSVSSSSSATADGHLWHSASEATLDLRKLLDGKKPIQPINGKELNQFEKWQMEHENKRKARVQLLLDKGKDKAWKNDPELLATQFALVDLVRDSDEFKKMFEILKQGSRTNLMDRVSRIRRIENSVVKKRFEAEKRRLEQKHGLASEYAQERRLYHGTKEDRAVSIARINFDLDIAGTSTGALYGRGVYFAPTATNAFLYGQCVLVCRTLPGRWHTGPTSEDMTEPPLVPGSSTIRFDSVADSANRPQLFIIFDENKICPEYIVNL